MSRACLGQRAVLMLDRIILGARKLCIGFGSGFFDGAGVVVLVARQGCPTCKRFLAICIGAFVRSLARVYSAVSCKRAGIAEWLTGAGQRLCLSEDASVAYLATSLAHMRFLSRVHTRVYGQCRSLNELFAAARPVTHMRSDTTVNPF